MRDKLAEQLLAKVMKWTPEDIARERPDLQIMARYKYDSYQKFFPGMRFIESLAQWLKQFVTDEERDIAYNFIKNKLIFCSYAEMAQLVSMAYPDYIRLSLLKETAKIIDYPEYMVTKIARSKEFQVLRRQSLFLGLSDGAHIDLFRRLNREELSHEQICASYDISENKAKELIKKLKEDINKITGKALRNNNRLFKNLILLDDFSGSGSSYLRKDNKGYDGKIARIIENINDPELTLSKILDKKNLLICIVLYMATEQAINHLKSLTEDLLKSSGYRYELFSIQYLDESIKVQRGKDKDIIRLAESYYDPQVESYATRVGGTEEVKLGYANCALPLILSHNTPNNSIALLWSHEYCKVRGLFPRVKRH